MVFEVVVDHRGGDIEAGREITHREPVDADLVDDLPADGSWMDRVVAMAVSLTDHAGDHANASSWVMTAYARRGPMLRLHETMLEVMTSAGLTLEHAIVIKAAVLRMCIGHLVLERAAPHASAASLSPIDYPLTIAAQPIIDATDRRDQFERTLTATVTALAIPPSLIN